MTMTMVNTMVHVLTVEFLYQPTSYVIVVANSQAVRNAGATCPNTVSVQSRLRFVRYCSKFDIIFIHYDSYYHMLYESAY